MLNPINHTRTAEGVERYLGEPYVVAADVYAHPMHVGRAGWTWYTGSAGWMHQAAVEGILGLRPYGSTFAVDPCIPPMWPGFSMEWRIGETRYRIGVENPEHRCRGVVSAALDGTAVDPGAIPLETGRPDPRGSNRARVGPGHQRRDPWFGPNLVNVILLGPRPSQGRSQLRCCSPSPGEPLHQS